MAKRIHFEDDVFYLNTRLRSLEDMLVLDVDPEFFLQKTLDDVDFIDATLQAVQDALLENERLIEREEQIRNLVETEETFIALIRRLADGRSAISAALQPFSERFSLLTARTRERARALRVRENDGRKEADDPLVVSPEELNELLKGME
jgi:hypothetical protein